MKKYAKFNFYLRMQSLFGVWGGDRFLGMWGCDSEALRRNRCLGDVGVRSLVGFVGVRSLLGMCGVRSRLGYVWNCVSVALLQAVRCLGIILGCWECDSEAYRRYRFRLL